MEEFDAAFGQFQEKGKPFIYTYFKDAPINTTSITHEIAGLLEFKDLLIRLGHFKTVFKSNDDLHLHFKKQLEYLLQELL